VPGSGHNDQEHMTRGELSPEELEKIGVALFGANWRIRMAERYKVNRSTVGRWANRKRGIPGYIAEDLKKRIKRSARRRAL
jgi:hypothetical protein